MPGALAVPTIYVGRNSYMVEFRRSGVELRVMTMLGLEDTASTSSRVYLGDEAGVRNKVVDAVYHIIEI